METNLLNPTTLELVIETQEVFPVIPGQYGRVALRDRDGIFYRSYSVVEADGKRLTFCIKLTAGRGGYVLRSLKVGDSIAIEGIYGSFVLQKNTNPKVFIATGTGLSPIVNMMRSLPDAEKTLLFGVQDSGSLFYTDLLQNISKLTTHIFLSREEVPGYRHGRIDCMQFEFPKGTEFYLCGNPAMIEQVTSDLKAQGFDKIYHEIF
ncbi:MAG: hypothetical protein PHH70_02280 [Candidatus Gracilibacteria bacterium]|nr:hypothetical protein [Candidatus Gracilibacteria bacterium]